MQPYEGELEEDEKVAVVVWETSHSFAVVRDSRERRKPRVNR